MWSRTGLPHHIFTPEVPMAPKEGSHPKVNENTIMSMVPSQKVGMDTPNSETDVTARSRLEYWFLAELTPTTIEIRRAMTSEIICSSMVYKIQLPIMVLTGAPPDRDFPKLSCKM